jgi:hypothetical protein
LDSKASLNGIDALAWEPILDAPASKCPPIRKHWQQARSLASNPVRPSVRPYNGSPVGWATSFFCPPTGKKVKPQNTPSPNQLKASSRLTSCSFLINQINGFYLHCLTGFEIPLSSDIERLLSIVEDRVTAIKLSLGVHSRF